MSAAKRSVVVGIFNDAAGAERAVRDLLNTGFKKDDIGFVMRAGPNQEGACRAADDGDNGLGAMVGGYTGAAAGGVLGGLLGLAISALVPGVGPVLAMGLVGLALGGAYVGGLTGALVGIGVPEHEAEHCHRQVQAGRSLVAVKAAERYSEAVAILSADGAADTVRQAEGTIVTV